MILNLATELESLKNQHLYRQLRQIKLTRPTKAEIDGQEVTVFASNDYLGLAHHPKVKEAAIYATEKFGCSASASRLISGNHHLYEQLEKALAQFKRYPAALVFPTGYMTNLGLLSSLANNQAVFYLDRLNHASLYDGWLLTRTTLKRYSHQNLDWLEKQLQQDADKEKFIITDGVFSMDGNLAPLAELKNLADKYRCCLIVDDAHGIGVLGPEGKGTAALLRVKVDIEIGTLSKALGAVGGFVCSHNTVKEYLINKARSFIFTTGLPPAAVAAALAALKVIKEEQWRQQRVLTLAKNLRLALQQAGYQVLEGLTPIIPIIIGNEAKALQLSQACLEKGIFIPAIRTPAVPKNKARLRLTVSAEHSDTEIESVVKVLTKAGKELRIVG